MREIRLQNIRKKMEKSELSIDLTIPGGKFFALLGPSGCGKTTLLRIIAGLAKADSGRIFLGEEEITDLPVNERPVNMVFQDYALFPHLNVYENIAYSLKIKKKDKYEIESRIEKTLRTCHIKDDLIHKPVTSLSGGQQQRVALARAIIDEPDVLLLDEPLAALDFKLREKVLVELIDLQDTLKTTFIYITHDQDEALTVSDQMAIMGNNGKIEQIGTPSEIYQRPKTHFVADFVGTTNLFKIKEIGDELVSLRPENITISKKPQSGYDFEKTGVVKSIIYYGRSTRYTVHLKQGGTLYVFRQNDKNTEQEEIDYEDTVHLFFQKESIVQFEKTT